ncbi:ABC transporter permease [Synoicihabitans lomoniglobus]|uniref:ABC transporter permease n=1 Tax=Synoicihabitans lomoniglobus TaxID=2909285 RepID=A0AAF0CPB5_9BACT|nr:ABC transporter permease [Opitutaceae bacterium LMO-M01]WED63874.1 ABC transporter permease [Opitutaceae bacterium LMO-M01]
MRFGIWINRLKHWGKRGELRRRLDEELAFHFDELVAEHERRGLSPAAARRAAQRDLGNKTLTRESYREQAGWPWLEELGRDISLALRNLTRRRGYALSMIGLLAVGLAATLSVYVLTDAMLRRALPVPEPEELHLIADAEGQPAWFSRATLDRLRANVPQAAVIAYGGETQVTVQRGRQPAQSVSGQLVSGGAFAGLGLIPAHGRLLNPGDDRIGEGAPVAVVSYAWAQREYGSAPAAVGQELLVNQMELEVVGVLPERFHGFDAVDRVDLFFPTALQPQLGISSNAHEFASDDRPNDPDWNRENRVRWLETLVRVPSGLAVATVGPALEMAVAPDREDLISQINSPEEREGVRRMSWQVVAAPGGYSNARNAFAGTGRMLTGLVVSLLLLTCANLSGIMLVRTLSRHREMGVRLSLGAGRWRTCRLAVVEAVVCGILGAVVGLLLATWMLPAAAQLLTPGATLTLELVGWSQLTMLVGVALFCSVGCALVPAWWIARLQPLVALNGAMGGGSMPQRVGRALVAVQLALAVMLVAVSLSLGGEIAEVLNRDPGFERDTVLTTRFNPRAAGYTSDGLAGLNQRLRNTVEQVPGVERVGLSSNGILAGSRSRSGVFPRGEGLTGRGGNYQQDTADIDYLATVGLRLLQGRWFEVTDTDDAPQVAVVTRAFARAMWGRADVIGEQFGYDYEATENDMTVIGIVADAGINQARETETEMFFTPGEQNQWGYGFLAVRVSRHPDAVRRMLVEALEAAEPGLVFGRWETLGERREGNMRREIASSRLATIIAGVAMLLATFGVGGSLAHLVTLRQRELAVRAALGATPNRLLRGVLHDGLRIGLQGAAGGGALVALVAWGVPVVSWWDASPSAVVGIVAAGGGVLAAVVGGWLPARRASRVDPQRMLKAD